MFKPVQMFPLAATLWAALGSSSFAEVTLPPIISNNMVLQKSAQTPLWGWATPGEKITITLHDKSVSTTAGADKKWLAHLNLSQSPKGPFTLTISGQNTLKIQNVLIGQVWFASGQSNMEFAVNAAKNATEEIAAANFPEIRQYYAAHKTAFTPQDDHPGDTPSNPSGWVVCTPQTAGSFSAVAFFFAREIHQKVNTPVGIIHSSWGGTVAEAWTSKETMATLPAYKPAYEVFVQQATDPEALTKALKNWERNALPFDTENTSVAKGWTKPDFDDTAWKTIRLPGAQEDQARELSDFDGSILFRKEFTLTAEQAQHDLRVELGTVDDFDTTYVNGTVIGQTGIETENAYSIYRKYPLPAKLLKAGKNLLAVRVFDRAGPGGIGLQGTPNIFEAQSPIVPLSGTWKYQIESKLAPTDLVKFFRSKPGGPGGEQNEITRLYNAMVHPFIPYGIAGVLWYQGESNSDRAYDYRTLFPAMIIDWRNNWKKAGGQETFPFYFVELANYIVPDKDPFQSTWAELREAQQLTLKLPDTGSASAIDTADNPYDIHPQNKQEVAHRLALNALAQVYGQKVEFQGPIFASKKIEGSKIRISFTHAEGLHARSKQTAKAPPIIPPIITGFAICGPDGKFVWADATLDGTDVLVSSPKIPNPTEVRYAWSSNPKVNLYNEAGLPASPFRTDSFQGITQPNAE